MISQVNRLPQTLYGQSRLNFHTRTFESFSLTMDKDQDAADVFESVKELTVARMFCGFNKFTLANSEKPLSYICMLSSTPQNLHSPPIPVGTSIRRETNLDAWALVLDRKLGASRIWTRITVWVRLIYDTMLKSQEWFSFALHILHD